jgi:hypothetical protein
MCLRQCAQSDALSRCTVLQHKVVLMAGALLQRNAVFFAEARHGFPESVIQQR